MIAAIKTVNDMRLMLSEEIVKLRTGKTTPGNVNAIVNASGKILTTIKMEMEYNKLLGKTPNIPFIQELGDKAKKGNTQLNQPENK